MNVDDRREALEAISVSAEASVQERLRALEMLRELPPSSMDVEERPDFAEELADDPERLTRVIDLSIAHGLFDDFPAFRSLVERRAFEIVEEGALERRSDFAVVDAQDARETTVEDEATEEPFPPREPPRGPENGSRRLEGPARQRRRQAQPFGGRAPRGPSFWGMPIE